MTHTANLVFFRKANRRMKTAKMRMTTVLAMIPTSNAETA